MDLETLLVLGAERPELSAEPVEVWQADSPLTAARIFAQGAPKALLVGGAAWAWRFVRRMPAHLRPAVIAVGTAPERAALADEWVPSPADASLAARLQLALARAGLRQTLARRALVDPLTGLANRRAVVAALRRGAFFARRANHPLTLLRFDLRGDDAVLRQAGGLLRRLTRRAETVGRMGEDAFALVLSGDLGDARIVVRRLEPALGRVGARTAWSSAQLAPGERLGALYARAESVLPR